MSITYNELKRQPDPKLTLQTSNFFHLYLDVTWYGVAFGSTLSFLPIFAARLGAEGWQIALLTAGPALISIFFTLSAGRWVEGHSLGLAVTRSACWHRAGYLVLVPLPFLLPAPILIWFILSLILLMAIPGTALMIAFNAMLATTVPPDWRGYVVGRRNALLAASIMFSFWLSGWILDRLVNLPRGFEWGYLTVFTIGAVGMTLSTYHLSRIQIPPLPKFQGRPLPDHAQPGRTIGFTGVIPRRLNLVARFWLQWRGNLTGNLNRISNRYRWAMLAFFLFHFSQMVPTALFPIFWVRETRLTDGAIGWISALFYLTMLIASPFLGRLTQYLGNHRLVAVSALLLSLYPLLTALSTDITLLIVASIIGGAVWAILSGSLSNRLLELIPDNDRPIYLALYNLALNVATLSSTMLGPLLSEWVGLREALFLVVLLRLASGLALARWG